VEDRVDGGIDELELMEKINITSGGLSTFGDGSVNSVG
jgi:hypothetical protein